MSSRIIDTTCAYCGVGCGMTAEVENQSIIALTGDTHHPANHGRLCVKGSTLADTVRTEGRLTQPSVSGQPVSWNEAISTVAKGFSDTIARYGADAVAFYVSGQLLTEDYYVANKLMKGYIGSANIDTNSRLCMSSSVAGHKRAFGSDTVPNSYEDLEQARLIVLTGSNTAWCHPVLFQRIKHARQKNPELKVVVIDPRETDTLAIADLHINLKAGTDVALFNGLFNYLVQQDRLDHQYLHDHVNGFEQTQTQLAGQQRSIADVAQQCDVDENRIQQFYDWFTNTEQVVTCYSQGVNQSSRGTDKVNSILNCHLITGRIGKPGCGPLSLTGQPNAMGGREVGGLANTLAAHMDFKEEDIATVQQFWNSPTIARQPGLKAVDLFSAVDSGRIKAIWIMATNPVVSLPNASIVSRALQRCEFVVVSDIVAQGDTSAFADVLLPAAGWGEKDGTVTNSERRISRQRRLLPSPGEARPDWRIICDVAIAMGFQQGFEFNSPADIFREHARLSGYQNHGQRDFDISALAEISDGEYDTLMPVQWPVNQQYPDGCKRLFKAGGFFTPNRKAQLIATTCHPPQYATDQEYPLQLNSGRSRDHWHTMTRTELAVTLNRHRSEPWVEIHPDTAVQYGIEAGHWIRIDSQWGNIRVRATISKRIRPEQIFVPIHWSRQLANSAWLGAVVNPAVDPFSGQPESKHTPVRICSWQPAWQAKLLTRKALPLPAVDYCVRERTSFGFIYHLAGDETIDHWQSWLFQQFSDIPGGLQVVTQRNAEPMTLRLSLLHQQQLFAALLVQQHDPFNRQWLTELFNRSTLDGEQMAMLLSDDEQLANDPGETVCSCHAVGKNTIINAIQSQRLSSEKEVGHCTRAGTNCGSCLPEIRALLQAQQGLMMELENT
ncbi:nitrate reductase [Gynuella sunshinyii]|nr:nitrate reductase [Gynuella sunshinyii]